MVRIREALLAHFDAHGRDLPWRGNPEPYGVWVSEVMLQQTRVSAVVPYFERWMRRFPTVEALAEADREEVLEAWAGLGYYSRARNLHRAAVVVCERFDGRLPETASALRTLPGVGDYTSGAIASIAFGRCEPAVDGNVRRVISRLYDLENPSPASLRNLVTDLQDPDRPGDFNQALMELGATVCTPRTPGCGECPLSLGCRAFANGTVAQRPLPRRRSRVKEAAFASLVVVDDELRTFLVRRPGTGLLAQMWEFPTLSLETSGEVLNELGRRSDHVLPPVHHQFTHLHARYHPLLLRGPAEPTTLRRVAASVDLDDRPTRVARLDELKGLAVPTGQLKIADRVREACVGSGGWPPVPSTQGPPGQ